MQPPLLSPSTASPSLDAVSCCFVPRFSAAYGFDVVASLELRTVEKLAGDARLLVPSSDA
jgi:hypothetical protein